MLEETETEETRGFFVAFLLLVTFQLEAGAGSLATPMCWAVYFRNKKAFSYL